MQALDAMGPHVMTVMTSFIMLECGNSASRSMFRSLVDQTRQKLEASAKLIVPDKDDWEQAWSAYVRGDAGEAGIVDHVSFVVMRRLGITDVFSNDHHFRSAGFNTLF